MCDLIPNEEKDAQFGYSSNEDELYTEEGSPNPNSNSSMNVKNKMILDSKTMYHKVCSNFNDIYASDEDNLLIMESVKDPIDGSVIKYQSETDDDKNGWQVEDKKTYIYPREYKNIGPVFSYGKNWPKFMKPKYQHPKDE